MQDAVDRAEKMVTQITVAEKELTACVGPMLTTAGVGHFGFLHEVKGSCAQEAALSLHVGMNVSIVVAQLPMIDADPHQHPMDQFRSTLEIAWRLKVATDQLWQPIARGTETAQKLSGKCRHLQTTVAKPVPGANHPEQDDVVPCAHGHEDQQASKPNQFATASGVDGAKQDESMADFIQHKAQSSPTTRKYMDALSWIAVNTGYTAPVHEQPAQHMPRSLQAKSALMTIGFAG